MKRTIIVLLALLFCNCWQMMFVSSLDEIDALGIDRSKVKKIEKIETGNSQTIYRIYYKSK